MKTKNKLLDDTTNKHNYPVNNECFENDSLQYNRQDLDQEQKVDVNPVQLNTQNVNVYVDAPKIDYSGKITGITLRKKDGEVLQHVDIYLYFGHKCGLPVYETTSDCNGNFAIENIPPGYYIIHAQRGTNLKYESHYIKVLPGQNVHQTLILSDEDSPSPRL